MVNITVASPPSKLKSSVFDEAFTPFLGQNRPIKKKLSSLFPVARFLVPAMFNKASKVLTKVEDEVRQPLMKQNHTSPLFIYCEPINNSPVFLDIFFYSVSALLFIFSFVLFVIEFLLVLTR